MSCFAGEIIFNVNQVLELFYHKKHEFRPPAVVQLSPVPPAVQLAEVRETCSS